MKTKYGSVGIINEYEYKYDDNMRIIKYPKQSSSLKKGQDNVE